VGCKLYGRLREGVTATDLVLTVTQMLRKKGVVDKFVEFYGSGLSQMTLPDRATVANMAPEYGATMGFFPVDEETLRYLRTTGRAAEEVERVERYCKEQGLFRTDQTPDPIFSDTLELDLDGVESSLAGPKRPQDRVPLKSASQEFKAGLEKEGMAINLGGVAKGYIVSKAAAAMEKSGVTRAIIHAGGDMTVFQKDTKKPFTIGIQHPREKKLLGEAFVYNGAIATSGDYERFFIKDGVRYHHILDPKTGFPSRGTQGVTLIAKDPTVGDALSTAVFVLGPEKGMALIEKLDGVEGVIVGEDGSVRVSSGFEGKIY